MSRRCRLEPCNEKSQRQRRLAALAAALWIVEPNILPKILDEVRQTARVTRIRGGKEGRRGERSQTSHHGRLCRRERTGQK